MNNFIQQNGVWIKKGLNIDVDGLVLDIDGVVLEVSESFRQCISQTTQYYFHQILKYQGQAKLIEPQETTLFKNAGGFNNDWDLTFAVCLFYLVKTLKFDEKNVGILRRQAPFLQDWVRSLAPGGGLKGAKKSLLDNLSKKDKQQVLSLWNTALIKQIFQELFGGVDYCRRLYGFDPRYIKEKGLINKEEILIDKELLSPFWPKVGILTGRTKEEVQIAVEKITIINQIDDDFIVYDDGNSMVKPHPDSLIKLSARMGLSRGVYIGDTVDDAKTVANYNKETGKNSFISAAVNKDTERFLQLADIVSDDINKILSFLGGENGKASNN
ncbi:MAG: hypothetical protein C4562_01840 [Actinobacteria bacterium]|nr:MAG: hypothetical protein C4562_01840 [Actinomycetota bacterium]